MCNSLLGYIIWVNANLVKGPKPVLLNNVCPSLFSFFVIWGENLFSSHILSCFEIPEFHTFGTHMVMKKGCMQISARPNPELHAPAMYVFLGYIHRITSGSKAVSCSYFGLFNVLMLSLHESTAPLHPKGVEL